MFFVKFHRHSNKKDIIPILKISLQHKKSICCHRMKNCLFFLKILLLQRNFNVNEYCFINWNPCDAATNFDAIVTIYFAAPSGQNRQKTV